MLTLRHPGAVRVGRAFIVLGPAGEDWLMNKDIDNCFGDPKEALSRRCGRGVVFYGMVKPVRDRPTQQGSEVEQIARENRRLCATNAVSRRPLISAYRPFVGPVSKGA